MLFDCGWGELCEYGKHKSGRQTWITYQIDFMPKVSLPNSPAYRTNPKETKRENEKVNEVHDKLSHNTFSTKSIFLTRATPTRYPSSLSFSLPKVPTYTPYWIKNVKDDFFIPSSFPNNIISKQFFQHGLCIEHLFLNSQHFKVLSPVCLFLLLFSYLIAIWLCFMQEYWIRGRILSNLGSMMRIKKMLLIGRMNKGQII